MPFVWTGRELNPRHMDFQSIALPTELPVRISPNLASRVVAAKLSSLRNSGSRRFPGGIQISLVSIRKIRLSTKGFGVRQRRSLHFRREGLLVQFRHADLAYVLHVIFSTINADYVPGYVIGIVMREKCDSFGNIFRCAIAC